MVDSFASDYDKARDPLRVMTIKLSSAVLRPETKQAAANVRAAHDVFANQRFFRINL
jgi:hypothetical protein